MTQQRFVSPMAVLSFTKYATMISPAKREFSSPRSEVTCPTKSRGWIRGPIELSDACRTPLAYRDPVLAEILCISLASVY